MPRLGRLVSLFALAAACGCSWSKRPYTNDPLLAGGRGAWGKHAARPAPEHDAEPTPPPAPPDPKPVTSD